MAALGFSGLCFSATWFLFEIIFLFCFVRLLQPYISERGEGTKDRGRVTTAVRPREVAGVCGMWAHVGTVSNQLR